MEHSTIDNTVDPTNKSVQQCEMLTHEPDKIRNISVIAHVDHGKTTLIDSLLAGAGLIRREDIGKNRNVDTRGDEKVTSSSIVAPLLFEHAKERYLVNMVNCPGHVDFSSEVTNALQVTDGALLVVDCIEGVWVHDTVIRKAVTQRIRPVLHVNKVDRCITELQLLPEELYHMLDRNIQTVNTIIHSTCEDETLASSFELDPRKGNVSFGSGKQGWAFTLPQIARMYAKMSNIDPEKILTRLWGDHFYDVEAKRFTHRPFSQSGKPLERFFCKAILGPVYQIFNSISGNNTAELENVLTKLHIELSSQEKEYTRKDLLSCVMQKFLFAADTLSEMIVTRLPSPRVAQRYRAGVLYTGPVDDEVSVAIRDCNPRGPAIMFVTKLIAAEDSKSYYAYGRVFSGTLRSGSKVLVMRSEYQHLDTLGDAVDHEASLQRTERLVSEHMIVQNLELVDNYPISNTVAVVGASGELYLEVLLT